MFTKIIVFCGLVASCYAGIIGVYPEGQATSYIGNYNSYQAPIYGHGYGHGYGYSGHEGYKGDYYAHPKYKFSYGVNDPHTGDHKSQEEYRDGDVVKGHYTVAEPDGTLRVVHYTADDHNGFNAVVEKRGHSIHPEPHLAPVVVEKVVPIVEKYEKPVYDSGYHHGYGHAYGQHLY